MNMTKLKPLIKWLVEIGFTQIEITEGDQSLRVCRQAQASEQPVSIQIPSAAPVVTMASPTQPAVQPQSHSASSEVSGHKVRSPMVGTLYASSSPDAPPFVTVGKKVNVGDTLCIIEAMKMFNEIEADRAGTIKAILVSNGEPVEFDQPLFVIE